MKEHPTVTPEGLEALLRQVRHPLRLDDILRMAALPRRSKGAVLDALESLEAEGRIFRLRGGKWTDAGQVKTITGVLSVQRSGSGFLTIQAGNESRRDVFIPAALMGDALHGDTAEAILLPGRSAPAHGLTAEARIVRVVRRSAKMLAARVIGPKAYFAAPSDASMHRQRSAARPLPPAEGLYAAPADPHFPILLDVDCSALPHAPKKGTLLLAELLGRRPDGVWNAAASSLLENEHSAEVQERLTRLNHMIPFDFPPDVAAEAAGLEEALPEASPEKPSGSTGQRIDLRDLPFVTIDGPDARDFDDAICVEGNALWVAIADVSLYVRPRSALDREALTRGNSCYFPCSVTPMLPEKLCNDLCSLRANRSRPVLAARLTCNEKGLADSADFFPAVILPRANLTYEGVQAMLDGSNEAPSPECPLPDASLAPMLRQAAGLAARMIETRARRGALDLDLPEAGFLFDENGQVCGITRRARLFAHRLIEAFMLAANEAAAAFLTQKNEPFPLRAHPAPARERLESLFASLRATGLAEKLPQKLDAFALRPLLEGCTGTPQARIVPRLVLRAMMQARYIPGPAEPALSRHFGIASSAYCHFTSPIRRYADLMVHRAIKKGLGTPDKSALPSGKKLLAACERCNECERTAQDAEREITRRLACLLLEGRVGETFSCVVSGVTPFGLFAEPEDFPVEGLVKIESLTDDWYMYDEKRQMLLGSRTGRTWRLGQEIRVRLEAVSLDRLEIDFLIADGNETPDTAPHGKHIRRRPLKDAAPHGYRRNKNTSHERKAGHAKSHAASRRRRKG